MSTRQEASAHLRELTVPLCVLNSVGLEETTLEDYVQCSIARYVTEVHNPRLHPLYLPSRVTTSLSWRTMFLEAVWSAIPELEWQTPEGLGKTSGLDPGTLKQAVEFLVRWEFVEVKLDPELQVRRKAGAVSPVEIASLLRSVSETETATPSSRVLAIRIACRACAGRTFSLIGPNEVQCANCHEKQWHTIEIDEGTLKLEDTRLQKRPGILEQVSVRLR